jgi:hypothetical protein
MSSAGPALALVGSLVIYTLTLKNEGDAPILVRVGDQLHGAAPRRAQASQGRCDPFSRHATAWITECELGGLLPGDVATVSLPVVPNRVGTLESVGLRSIDPGGTQVQTATTRTDVVRCSLLGTQRADRLRGTRRADVVCGFGGNDRIDVRGGGVDTVFCGTGRDTVLADASDRVAPDCEVVHRLSA